MGKYKGLIFDLDGTLLDTIDDIHYAMNVALKENGLNEVSRNDVLTFIGNGVNKLIERALIFCKVDVQRYFEKVKSDYKKEYQVCSKNQTKPFEGMIDVLTFLKKEGLKLAVLSNKPHDDALEVINTYFPNIFDAVSGAKEGYNVKPDPRLAFEILNELNIKKEEVLFVGDSDVDIFTANNAGMDSVAALYGYRTEKELRQAKANYYIKSPKGLLKFFRKEINGVLLIDKPVGYTSQDVVTVIKHKLNIEKAGHAGTLDPFASGLLVVLLGNATKLSNYLLEENKEYVAKVVIGVATDTLDCDGQVISVKKVEEELDVDRILKGLIGEVELTPPMYSAIKINGQKMYDLARKGQTIELEKRVNNIYKLERISDVEYSNGLASFDILCNVSKGTYIRSLCEKIGARLGYPAYLESLRRTKSGQMNIVNSYSLEDLNGEYNVLSIVDALKGKRVVKINDVIYNRVKNGMKIYLNNESEEVVFLEYNNDLVAIYELNSIENKQYIARRVWK